MAQPIKYTKEILTKACKNAFCISDVIRNLGLEVTGSNHRHITSRVKFYNIDTAHFDQYKTIKNRPTRKLLDAKEILIFGKLFGSKILKRALKENGIEDVCIKCGIGNLWNDEPLTLQVDHIDGNRQNNKIENLRILCPNCHTQTLTYGVKNIKIKVVKNLCGKCSKQIVNTASLCRNCYFEDRREKSDILLRLDKPVREHKINWPTIDELLERLSKSNYSKLGRELGVSDNAIRKHIKLRMAV